LSSIANLIIFRKFRKDMVLFVEGEPGEGLFFVKQGKVKLSKLLPDGRQKILNFVREGDIFAEVLLFERGSYPVSAEAMEECRIGLIRNRDMENLLLEKPQLAIKILGVMSRRLRRAQAQNRDLAFQDTYGRLASSLITLAQQFGRKTDQGVVLELALNQQDIGNLIGASRETVARCLADFKKKGLISSKARTLIIKDMAQLKEWGER